MKFILSILVFFSLQSQGQIINASPPYRVTAVAVPPSCSDADAQKFIDSTGISGTEATAICTLVQDLKDSSLWTSMAAIYPFVGGTATTCKWNLKDPQNTDAAYRLVFTGGWTYTSGGADPNGSTGVANTFINTSTTLSNYDRHWSIYYGEHTTNTGWNGAFNGSSVAFGIQVYDGANISVGTNNIASSGVANADTKGFYVGSITGSGANLATVYKTGVSKNSVTANSMINNLNFYIGALNNNGTANLFTNRIYSFVSLGAGLTSDNIRALNTIVEKFNDALSRGVQ